MKLNSLSSLFSNQNRKRRGRGIGSGLGKTAGAGHKGQKARRGYSRNYAFEGGQSSLCRRVPKSGFTSKRVVHDLPLSALNRLKEQKITLDVLKQHNLISHSARKVRIYLSGTLHTHKDLSDLYCTKGVIHETKTV